MSMSKNTDSPVSSGLHGYLLLCQKWKSASNSLSTDTLQLRGSACSSLHGLGPHEAHDVQGQSRAWQVHVFSLQMWCGPTSCHLSAKGRGGCPSGQTCVPIRDGHCFVKPCSSFGECWHSSHPSPPTKCHPSTCYQDNSCSNITFTFNKETMPQVSHLCSTAEIQVIFHAEATLWEHLKKNVWSFFSLSFLLTITSFLHLCQSGC